MLIKFCYPGLCPSVIRSNPILLNVNLIERLTGVPDGKRTARFVCCVAAAFPDRKTEVVRGTIEGRIGYKEEGENGFGYDPIFYVPEYGCTTASMSSETKNAISHRGKALQLILIQRGYNESTSCQ